MNYTQHLFIWHAKYTPHHLCSNYWSLYGSTPVPQCDKSLMPHLGAPTESFSRDALLIHLIFHVAQCLTSHCGLWRLGESSNVYSLICHCLIAFCGEIVFQSRRLLIWGWARDNSLFYSEDQSSHELCRIILVI